MKKTDTSLSEMYSDESMLQEMKELRDAKPIFTQSDKWIEDLLQKLPETTPSKQKSLPKNHFWKRWVQIAAMLFVGLYVYQQISVPDSKPINRTAVKLDLPTVTSDYSDCLPSFSAQSVKSTDIYLCYLQSRHKHRSSIREWMNNLQK